MSEVMHTARFADLDAATIYAILRLRAEVFVVEQRCAYLDVDDRDRDDGTLHLWFDGPSAYLRIIELGDGTSKIGRVVTSPEHRNQGLAERLLRHAIDMVDPHRAIVIDAQSRLNAWYERFGFVRSGPDFVEDDIMHTPMRLPPRRTRD